MPEIKRKHKAFPWVHPQAAPAASNALYCRNKGATPKVSEALRMLHTAYRRHYVYTMTNDANYLIK
jgi:hypothetical protein